MDKEKKKVIMKFLIFVLVIVIINILFFKPLYAIFSDLNSSKQIVLRFKFLSPIIFIMFVAVQVILAPVPGQIAGFLGGYLFGIVLGTLYCMVGLVVGSYIIFLASRKYGRPFVEKIISKKQLKKFDKLSSKSGAFALFLIYFFPVFPDDIISYMAGLTKIKIRKLLFISVVGRFPSFLLLNIIGAGFSYNIKNFLIISSIILFIYFLVYLFREKLRKFVFKISHSGKYKGKFF